MQYYTNRIVRLCPMQRQCFSQCDCPLRHNNCIGAIAQQISASKYICSGCSISSQLSPILHVYAFMCVCACVCMYESQEYYTRVSPTIVATGVCPYVERRLAHLACILQYGIQNKLQKTSINFHNIFVPIRFSYPLDIYFYFGL